MIKKLRAKFITLAMLSMLIVLAILIGGINILNYRNVVEDADRILKILSDNDGMFPERTLEEEPAGDMTEAMDPGDRITRPQMMPPAMEDGIPVRSYNPEIAFESRYFSVLLSDEGQVLEVDTERIYAISETKAIEYASGVSESDKETGFSDGYRYMVSAADEGTRVTFYDCGRSLDNFRNFRNISILISLAGLIVVFILIFFLSGLIVRPVAESYDKQKRFITDAGHEIKTPLAIINADTDVLELETGDGNEWTTDIRKQVTRLTELTNDLIFLSKMEEDETAIVTAKFDLSEAVRDIADSFVAPARTSRKAYSTDVEDGISYIGDVKAIRQLTSILLDNALKYSPEEGNIELILRSSSKGIKLYVSNSIATPMTDDDLKHMFDRFYRTDKSRNSMTGGYGIGLSIANAVVKAHKGRISAACDTPDTLTIKVFLP